MTMTTRTMIMITKTDVSEVIYYPAQHIVGLSSLFFLKAPSIERSTQVCAQLALVEEKSHPTFSEKAQPFVSQHLTSCVGWSSQWGCHL